VLDQMKRSKLGGRKFLRDMPWYVIIGPPGTGKTTALKQSGLHFPIDLSDDIKGVGGTRNCDWFFTEEAVLVDTAGRYTSRKAIPRSTPPNGSGFLGLLTKHRGRRALNGVILTLSCRGASGRRARSAPTVARSASVSSELREKLRSTCFRLPDDHQDGPHSGVRRHVRRSGHRAREQVWGATLADRRARSTAP
jgi:type VI secretion system protein ImpL